MKGDGDDDVAGASVVKTRFLFGPELGPVVTHVPLHELPEARGEVGAGLVREIAVGQAHIRVCVGNVAVRRHLYHVFFRLRVQQAFQNRHQVPHRHRRGVAQIVNPQLGCSTLLPTAPRALLRGVQSPEAPLHDVVDVGEVTRHLLPLPRLVHVDGLPLEDVFREEKVSHVGSPPGAVHREEPEAGQGEPVNVVVGVGDFLARFLGGGVEAGGLVGPVEFREGVLSVEAVDGAGGSPDDGGLGVGGFGDFEKVDEACNVGGDVGLGVLHGVADAGLGGEVEDVGEGDDVEELLEQGLVVEVPFDDEYLVLPQHCLAGSLEGGVVVGVEVVQTQNPVPPPFQGERAVAPDEARRPRDEDGEAVGAARSGGVADLLLPGAECGGEEVGVGVEVAVGGVGEGRVVEGEEEYEDECDEEGGAEEELGGGV